MRRDFLSVLIVFVVSVIFLQGIFLASFVLNPSFNSISNTLPTAMATNGGSGVDISFVSFCFSEPPTFDFSDCQVHINQSTRIEDNSLHCKVGINHPETSDIVVSEHHTYTEMYDYAVDSEGNIVFNSTYLIFDSGQDIANFSIEVYAEVFEPCHMVGVDNFSVFVHEINDPPEFVVEINDTSLRPGNERTIVLDRHFFDPDGDPLNYSFYLSGPKFVAIDNEGVVTIRNPIENCDPSFVRFTAKDPYGLTAESNFVRIDSLCFEDAPEDSGGVGGGDFERCEEDWKCEEWNECLVNGTQSRICEDLHRCDSDYTKTFWRDCDYIPPTFFDDEVELLVDPDATCFDGVQNCHVLDDGSILCEEAVDCGGPCEPCRRIESPGIMFDEEADSTLMVFALVVVFISALITTYFLFRREILSFFARLGWWLTRKKRKQFLLKLQDKKDLLEAVNALYDKIQKSSESSFNRKSKELMKCVGVSRDYLSSALWVSEEFSDVEVKKGLSRRVLNDSLKNGMSLYIQSLFFKERKSSVVSKQELLNFVQETRMLILNTSKLSKEDFNFRALELELPVDSLARAQILIHNAYLALCFSEAVSAQKNYYDLLALYEKMSDEEKVKVYYELSKIYSYTKTVLSWV